MTVRQLGYRLTVVGIVLGFVLLGTKTFAAEQPKPKKGVSMAEVKKKIEKKAKRAEKQQREKKPDLDRAKRHIGIQAKAAPAKPPAPVLGPAAAPVAKARRSDSIVPEAMPCIRGPCVDTLFAKGDIVHKVGGDIQAKEGLKLMQENVPMFPVGHREYAMYHKKYSDRFRERASRPPH